MQQRDGMPRERPRDAERCYLREGAPQPPIMIPQGHTSRPMERLRSASDAGRGHGPPPRTYPNMLVAAITTPVTNAAMPETNSTA
jgi:hypothetical protein